LGCFEHSQLFIIHELQKLEYFSTFCTSFLTDTKYNEEE